MMVPRDAEAYATVAGANPTARTLQTPATPPIARIDADAYLANPPRVRTLQTPATLQIPASPMNPPIARMVPRDADTYAAAVAVADQQFFRMIEKKKLRKKVRVHMVCKLTWL